MKKNRKTMTPAPHMHLSDRYREYPNGFSEGERTRIPQPVFHYTWSAPERFEYYLIGYTLQQTIRKYSGAWLNIRDEIYAEVAFDPAAKSNVIEKGTAAFLFEGKLIGYEANPMQDYHRIFSDADLTGVVETLNTAIRRENPLRQKHVQVTADQVELSARVRPTPTVTLDQIVLPPGLKEDILDNTVHHLQYTDGNNGIILHGPPGTGKSMTCQAIIGETIRAGFSTCYLVSRINFETLEPFIERYLAPCLLVLEDLDSFAEERRSNGRSYFSDFLQFMSGLTERTEKTVVVATTNHLDLLDRAVANRPARFNRRYAFDLPGERALAALLAHYFPGAALSPDAAARCHRASFTGSHIAELHRTAQIIARKTGRPPHTAFDQAFQILDEQFGTGRKSTVGYGSG